MEQLRKRFVLERERSFLCGVSVRERGSERESDCKMRYLREN